MTPGDLATLVQDVADRFALPHDLLAAQIDVESSRDPYALRYERAFFTRYILNNPKAKAGKYGPFAACSIGLLQILVETAYEIGFEGEPWELFDPAIGLEWGAIQMAALVKKTPDYRSALAAYNAGLGDLAAGLPYADKVYARARRLQGGS